MFSSFWNVLLELPWLPWLRLCTSNAGGMEVPSGELRNPNATWCSFFKKVPLILQYSQKKIFFSLNVLNNLTWWYYCSHFKDKETSDWRTQAACLQSRASMAQLKFEWGSTHSSRRATDPSLPPCTVAPHKAVPTALWLRVTGAMEQTPDGCKHTSPHCPVVSLSGNREARLG